MNVLSWVSVILGITALLIAPISATTQCQTAAYCGANVDGCTSTLETILGSTSAYKTGESAYIAVNVTTNSTSQMAQFFPKVDEYVVLEIPDTAGLLHTSTPKVSFSVLSSSGYIPLAHKTWSTGSHYVGSRSAVVTLAAGVITNLTWDGEGCEGICDSSACVDGWCGIPFPTNLTTCGEACNIKIYLVWSGTDEENKKLISGDYAFSKFQNWWIFDPWKLLVIAANVFSNFGNAGFTDLTSIVNPF